MTTQSIIVYRNPMEQQFWESMQGAQIFPVMVGIVVFFIVFLATMKIGQFIGRPGTFSKMNNVLTNVSLLVGALAGIATMFWMVQ